MCPRLLKHPVFSLSTPEEHGKADQSKAANTNECVPSFTMAPISNCFRKLNTYREFLLFPEAIRTQDEISTLGN